MKNRENAKAHTRKLLTFFKAEFKVSYIFLCMLLHISRSHSLPPHIFCSKMNKNKISNSIHFNCKLKKCTELLITFFFTCNCNCLQLHVSFIVLLIHLTSYCNFYFDVDSFIRYNFVIWRVKLNKRSIKMGGMIKSVT